MVQSASEKAKLRVSLEEKSQLIQSLREEVTVTYQCILLYADKMLRLQLSFYLVKFVLSRTISITQFLLSVE